MWLFFRVAAFCLVGFQIAASQMESGPSEIFWGIKKSNLDTYLVHRNGKLAWSGVRQGKHYNPAHAFYHMDGSIVWDGMKRTRNSWGDPSEKGIFYHSNGLQAWGGILQKLNSWGDSHQEGIYYHGNGQVAWRGIQQKITTFGDTRQDAFIYHSNGEKAWGGLSFATNREEARVYHNNGQIAWDGNHVYDRRGALLTSYADYISLHLGYNSWLYVDKSGSFSLSLYLGEGYELVIFKEGVSLKVLDHTVELN